MQSTHMNKTQHKQFTRARRHNRIRAKVSGTAERPRLAVAKSNRYITVQLINDETGTSIAQISTRNLPAAKGKPMLEAARLVGVEIAVRAKETHIEKAVFDRGGFIYTGAVRAVADGAREGGLHV